LYIALCIIIVFRTCDSSNPFFFLFSYSCLNFAIEVFIAVGLKGRVENLPVHDSISNTDLRLSLSKQSIEMIEQLVKFAFGRYGSREEKHSLGDRRNHPRTVELAIAIDFLVSHRAGLL